MAKDMMLRICSGWCWKKLGSLSLACKHTVEELLSLKLIVWFQGIKKRLSILLFSTLISSGSLKFVYFHVLSFNVLSVFVCVCVCVYSVISALCYPMECSLVGSSAHEFSRQEYWSRLPLPTLRDLLIQGSNPCLLCLLNWQVSYLPLVPPGKPCIICM